MNLSTWMCRIPKGFVPFLTGALFLAITASTASAQQSANYRGKSLLWADKGPKTRAISNARPMQRSAGNISADNSNVKYKALPIGVLPGKTNSDIAEQVSVINNLGHVVGFSFVYTGHARDYYLTAQAFLWKNGNLKALPLLKGWPGAFATGINDRDQVIGEANNFDSNGNRTRTAILWDEGKVINLGTLDSNSNSAAFGINNWGIAVGFNHSLSDEHNTPVLWYGGSVHALPLLPGESDGVAFGINDFGVISGYQQQPGDVSETASLWYWNGSGYTAVALGNLGGDYSEAFGDNIWGQAVGFSLYAGDLHGPAVLWDWRGPHALPMLPSDTDGEATAINDLEQIVGFSQLFDDFGDLISERVVLWQNGKVTDLQTVVPADTPDLTDVGNVNRCGEIAIQAGYFDDGTLSAYVLIPKEH
jgi:probable HAF family extracellular repeat protein